MLFILTGVSGAGKSTMLDALRSQLPAESFRLADIDELGVPSNVDAEWRRSQVARWYTEALDLAKLGTSVVLSGTVLPDDIPASGGRALPVRFCLLEASPEAISTRLRSRYADASSVEQLQRVSGLAVGDFIDKVVADQPGFRACYERCSFDWFAMDTSALSERATVREALTWIRGAV